MQKQPSYIRSAAPAKAPLHFPRAAGFWSGRWVSLNAAVAGASYTIRTQHNAWIELVAIVGVSAAGWWFGISTLEWAIIILLFALILALEAVNTAIETIIDLVSPQYHPLAKIAKDTAAGALLFAVIGSVGVALLIFGPYLMRWRF